METIRLRLKGIAPLLMHNNRLADPLNPYVQALKPLTAKKKKTDANLVEIGRIEWEGGLYINDGLIALPARVFWGNFYAGARKTNNGPKWKSGGEIDGEFFELHYKGVKAKLNGSKGIPNPELDGFYEKHHYRCLEKVQRNTIPRVRPIFEDWHTDVDFFYDEKILNAATFLEIAGDAGDCGLCERRPRLGRYEFEVL